MTKKPTKPTDLKAETLNNLLSIRRKLTKSQDNSTALYTQIITKIDKQIELVSRMSPEELKTYLEPKETP